MPRGRSWAISKKISNRYLNDWGDSTELGRSGILMAGIYEAVALVLLGLCAPMLYRVFKGPTIADRVLATDAIGVLVANALALLSVQYGRAIYLDVAIVVAALGFIGTLAIAKVLESGKL